MSFQYQHLLVVLDPKQQDQAALNRALFLAKRWQSKITLFCCEFNAALVARNLLDPEQLEAAESALLNKRKGWLHEYAKSVAQLDIEVDIACCWGRNHYQYIMQYAESLGCDFIVKGTHKHPALAKLFFNPTDWQLLKSCSQPLLLAKDQLNEKSHQVVVAIDVLADNESQLNQALMNHAIDFSESINADLHVVHSYQLLGWDMMQEIVDGAGGYYVDVETHQQYIDKTVGLHRDKLLNFLEDYNVDLENVHLVEGEPEESIINLSNQLHAGFLFVGTTYRTGLLGSTAERILDNVESDVVAIKPPGFTAPDFN